MTTATLNAVYRELQFLRREIEIVKHALIPEEKISAKELNEIRKIRNEMESGKEKTLKEIIGK
ncbi:MAG: hypothetical protein ABIA76_00965 [Candidatus Diapherotrites archaeon]